MNFCTDVAIMSRGHQCEAHLGLHQAGDPRDVRHEVRVDGAVVVDDLGDVGLHAAGLALPDEGPAVHLELGQRDGGQRHGLVQQLAHAEADGEGGGVRGRALQPQPGAARRGRRHPARVQLGQAGQVRAGNGKITLSDK